MNKTVFLLLLILIPGCFVNHNEKRIDENSTQTTNAFYTIDFPSILENEAEIPLSEIANNISYILLESSGESSLGRIRDAKFTKDYIFIQTYGNPLLSQFDAKGKFIRYIGKLGKGPGEYDLIREFSIDQESGLIYIQPNWLRHIIVYTFEGKYLRTIKINRDDTAIIWSHDSLFICYSEPHVGNEEQVFTEINSAGTNIQTVKNYCKWNDPAPYGRMRSYQGQHYFYRLNNLLHFKGMYNDTIYSYDGNGKIVSKFSINLGKHKIPEEMIIERGLVNRIPTKFLWTTINESPNFVFIYYCSYDTDETDAEQGHGSLKGGHALYNKTNGVGKALQNKTGNVILFNQIGEWGYKNDLDGGPEFIPEFTTDSSAFHFISSLEMKTYLSSYSFAESIPKDLSKKTSFMNQMTNLKETDNDIIMKVKLK